MYQHFIKKQDEKKLSLFFYLISKDKVSTEELVSKFSVSKFTIKRYANDLNISLKELQKNKFIEIQQFGSFYYCVKDLSQDDLICVCASLKLLYLERSPTFQLFDLLFTSNTCTIYEISDSLLISENHSYKIIKQLNKTLTSFSISIEKSKLDQSFSVIGLEPNIRCIYLVLFVTLYQSRSWPFTKISSLKLKQTYSKQVHEILNKRSLSVQTRIDYLLAIMDTRIRQSHFIDSFPKDIHTILKVFMDLHDVTAVQQSFPPSFPISSHTKIKKNEHEFFNLILRMIDGTTDTDGDRYNIGKKLSQLENPITQFYKDFLISVLEEELSSNTSNFFFESLYFSVLYHCYSLYCTFNPMDVLYINQSSENQYITLQRDTMINKLQNTFIKKPLESNLINKSTVYIVGSVLAYCIPPFKSNVIYVYVQYAREPIGNKIITDTLKEIFSSNAIQFVSDVRKANIIISDSVENASTIDYFFFEDISLDNSWEQLFSFLKEKILHRFLD